MNKKITTIDFIERAKEIHGNKYNDNIDVKLKGALYENYI